MVVAPVLDPEMDSPPPLKGEDGKMRVLVLLNRIRRALSNPMMMHWLWHCGLEALIVMIDKGSGAKVMYPDMYEGLGLTPSDLTWYDTPLVAFDETIVTPAGQVKLTVEVGGRKELVDFIVVHSYSPYTAILGCPWIHTMGAVPSSLHQKVKFLTKQGIIELCRDQSMARRCEVAAIGCKQVEEVKPMDLL